MGVDFLQRIAPNFKKAVSRDSETVARMACGISNGGHRRIVVADGEIEPSSYTDKCLIVRLVGSELSVVDGLHEIGRVRTATPEVLRNIQELGGFTEGRVEHVNIIGGTFDVALP